MNPEVLVDQLGLTHYVVQGNIEGLTEEESRRCPEAGGNCANWILGHIVRNRNEALALLGKQPLFSEEPFEVYGDTPIMEPDQGLPFATLREQFEALQQPLVDALQATSAEKLAAPALLKPPRAANETVGSFLTKIVFHEAYHAGQLGVLRRIIGKPGAFKAPHKSASG